ncbi:zinc ribbon domain-containing protein [Kyrpidia tusciae]|uniref:zinc ribbon domain-containing protein n=1 Tax=Kyrpidia tusciae TaxID=33943 RepID=UPI0003003E14|nr:zinc ribbon domain-containing protein [Kyrpidia tusciae]
MARPARTKKSGNDVPIQTLTAKAKVVDLSDQDALLLGLLGFAATKLWNVANHHRRSVWGATGKIPDFVQQCRELKTNRWYKLLPSQSSQEILSELDDSYRSWFSHRKNGDPSARPPGFRKKETLSTVTFKQKAFEILPGNRVKLRLPKTYARREMVLEYHLPPDTTLGKVQQVKLTCDPTSGDWYVHIAHRVPIEYREAGIRVIQVSEKNTSTTCPLCNKRVKTARIQRGLFLHCGQAFNADLVGAYNILQRYLREAGRAWPDPSGVVGALARPAVNRFVWRKTTPKGREQGTFKQAV